MLHYKGTTQEEKLSFNNKDVTTATQGKRGRIAKQEQHVLVKCASI